MLLDVYKYCELWNLTVSISKTNIRIFGDTRKDYEKVYYLDHVVIENIKEYKYLGIWFENANTFNWCKKHLGIVHLKYPVLLIAKSNPCYGGSGLTLSLSEWSSTIIMSDAI